MSLNPSLISHEAEPLLSYTTDHLELDSLLDVVTVNDD